VISTLNGLVFDIMAVWCSTESDAICISLFLYHMECLKSRLQVVHCTRVLNCWYHLGGP